MLIHQRGMLCSSVTLLTSCAARYEGKRLVMLCCLYVVANSRDLIRKAKQLKVSSAEQRFEANKNNQK